jgi:methylenetetrahydrofolate dehydrogenase (NADP+)/methenyltetrahydrofolate cyclohydrolase
MIILDGKKLAEKILDKLKGETKKIPASPAGGPPMKLAVILVGNDPASLNFIKQKQKAAEVLGINFKLFNFPNSITEKKLTDGLKKIVKDKSIYGVVVQLPLPKHLNEQRILDIIPQKKDVDALSVDNFLVEPPAASAIMEILNFYHIKVRGKKVIIVGKGKLVGKPLAIMMKKQGANLFVCDRKTKNLASKILKADILVSATGQPHLIKENMVKKGVVVIDAGFHKCKGDVDFEKVKRKAAYITPVPGGVGPMTVAMLFSNLIKLAKK